MVNVKGNYRVANIVYILVNVQINLQTLEILKLAMRW